jgi:hypothetical protein
MLFAITILILDGWLGTTVIPRHESLNGIAEGFPHMAGSMTIPKSRHNSLLLFCRGGLGTCPDHARIAQGHKGRALPPFQDMNEGLSQARDNIAIRPVKCGSL